jgi:hypothetical protein
MQDQAVCMHVLAVYAHFEELDADCNLPIEWDCLSDPISKLGWEKNPSDQKCTHDCHSWSSPTASSWHRHDEDTGAIMKHQMGAVGYCLAPPGMIRCEEDGHAIVGGHISVAASLPIAQRRGPGCKLGRLFQTSQSRAQDQAMVDPHPKQFFCLTLGRAPASGHH